MLKTKKAFWIAYFLLYLNFTLSQLIQFSDEKSNIHFYYKFLYTVDLRFLFPYLLNATQIILNLIHAFPILFYSLKIEVGRKIFWKYLFILRIIFEIFGHSFETSRLMAYFKTAPHTLFFLAFTFLIFYLPSYWSNFGYAFRTPKNSKTQT